MGQGWGRRGQGGLQSLLHPKAEAHSSVTLGMVVGSLNSRSGRESGWPSLVPVTPVVLGGGCQRYLGGSGS